jgi:hypothetical protein
LAGNRTRTYWNEQEVAIVRSEAPEVVVKDTNRKSMVQRQMKKNKTRHEVPGKRQKSREGDVWNGRSGRSATEDTFACVCEEEEEEEEEEKEEKEEKEKEEGARRIV